MGWDRNARWNHDVLQSIVALLFALAHLAERAAFCPARRRRHVLGIVSHGEAVARAFVMGVEHGAWCVGCCWMLMALLFVGGLMNFAWIAVLTFLVLIEKLAPAGPIVGRISGVVLLAWAVATILR